MASTRILPIKQRPSNIVILSFLQESFQQTKIDNRLSQNNMILWQAVKTTINHPKWCRFWFTMFLNIFDSSEIQEGLSWVVECLHATGMTFVKNWWWGGVLFFQVNRWSKSAKKWTNYTPEDSHFAHNSLEVWLQIIFLSFHGWWL